MIIQFYTFWHGRLKLPGAGFLLRTLARCFPAFRTLKLQLPDGGALHLNPLDSSCFYWLNEISGDRYEEDALVSVFRKYVTPTSVIWDVGGNCGLFSYKSSQGLAYRSWVVFEPNNNVGMIARAALQDRGVSVEQLALSDHDGDSTLVVTPGCSLKGTLSPEKTCRAGDAFQIRCRRGDSLTKDGFAIPDLIKIDAEGHEPEVLRGLEGILTEHSPIVFFEHLSLTDQEIHAIVPAGYIVRTVNNRTRELCAFDRTASHNSALIPKRLVFPVVE